LIVRYDSVDLIDVIVVVIVVVEGRRRQMDGAVQGKFNEAIYLTKYLYSPLLLSFTLLSVYLESIDWWFVVLR